MAAGKKEAPPKKPENGDQAADGKQKKKKLFLLIGVVVLLIAISVGATFFVVSKMMAKKHAEAGDAVASEPSEPTAAAAIYYPLKPSFTVNYDVNGRQRFLQTEITLMYRDAALLAALELHMPALRNSLVMLLSSQVFDELQTAEGKENLRLAALTAIQDILAKEAAASATKDKDAKKVTAANIEQVLFTQFVMQ